MTPPYGGVLTQQPPLFWVKVDIFRNMGVGCWGGHVPRLSGHGRRGALHVPRMAGVWGAGVAMVAAPGMLGPVALIPHGCGAGHAWSCGPHTSWVTLRLAGVGVLGRPWSWHRVCLVQTVALIPHPRWLR